MKALHWENKAVGDFDVFLICNEVEHKKIIQYYKIKDDTVSQLDNKYFYFLNKKSKTITPMKQLSFAFGGQYNGYAPYGEEIENFNFVICDYKLSI